MLLINMNRIFAGSLLTLLAISCNAAENGVILQYHHVDSGTPASTSISVRDFEKHLRYLKDNDFTVIRLDRMIETLRNQQEIPDKSVAITFDDGYLSIYEKAFPLLKSFAYPFTLFVSTQPIDTEQQGFMNWEQIQEMADYGAIVANHLTDHAYMLDRHDGENERDWLERLRRNLAQAEQRIRDMTGQSHRYLAYPYGEFDSSIKDMLRTEDFIGFAQNSGAIGHYSDFLALPRYPLAGIYADLDTAGIKFDSLAFHVSELLPPSPVTFDSSPNVTIDFENGPYSLAQISCFANGEPVTMTWTDRNAGIVRLNPEQSFESRRWRYICTAPAPDSDRYYWYSVQWINPRISE